MIITKDTLDGFDIDPLCKTCQAFLKAYPDGIDISPIWGNEEESENFWKMALADEILKKLIGWGIYYGLIPSRIRADLTGANLSGANLSGANLSRAYLTGADLSFADLTGADLYRADLSGADLSEANLSGADLRGAYLIGAYLSGADLRNAISNNTTWPEGYEEG